MRNNAKLFVAIAVVVGLGAAIYLGRAMLREQAPVVVTELPQLSSAPVPEGPLLVFARRSGSPDGKDGSLGVASVGSLGDARFAEAFRCDRVHMSGGRGVCLGRQGRFPVRYIATIFDSQFQPSREIELVGTPSRVQVASSGRLAGTTVFVSGHSYADNSFSTRASILDLESGSFLIEDFETLPVRRNGQVFREIDFNFWGVTFAADSRTFYATLGTGGKIYLVRGNVDDRVLEVVADDVECPSLSPDNTRIAFKQREATGIGPVKWAVAVLDLASGSRTRLAESRSVDDQVQWIDDQRVMYAMPGDEPAVMDMWAVQADGSGSPSQFLSSAHSAFVLR